MISLTMGLVTVIALLVGIPVAFSLGLGALVAVLMMGDIPLQILAQKIYSGMDSFPFLCIPFFIFAGILMGKGKITEKLLHFSILLIGRIRGGLGMANVLASMFFGGMTGSAIADVSALGSVEIPMMKKAGYDAKFSAAITASSAIIGPVIPPSIPMVVYAMAVGTSIGGLFLAGIIPGLLLGIALIIGTYIISRKRNFPVTEQVVSRKELLESLKKVYPALFLPVIIIGGIISGVFTPTEASAVAVLYSFIITVLVTKTIRVPEIPVMLVDSALTTGVVLFIAGTSTIWGWVIAMEQLNLQIAELFQGISPLTFLILVNILLFVLGTFMDNIPIILIFAPTLTPIATSLGIDPLHFGIIVCLNTTIGLITPPIGPVLFVAAPIANISLEKLSVEMLYQIIIICIVLLLVTYIPFLTLTVPKFFGFA